MSLFSTLLDFPPCLFSNEPAMELWGNKQLVLEGCKGILDYNENLIKISCGKYCVLVQGAKLELKNMSENSCLVTGVFEKLCFEL